MGRERRDSAIRSAELRAPRALQVLSLAQRTVIGSFSGYLAHLFSRCHPAALGRFSVHALIISSALFAVMIGASGTTGSVLTTFTASAPSPPVALQSALEPAILTDEEREPSSRFGREMLEVAPSAQQDQAAQDVPLSPVPRLEGVEQSHSQDTNGEPQVLIAARATNAEPAVSASPTTDGADVRATAIETPSVYVSNAIDPNPDHWQFLKAAIEPARASQRETRVPASVTIAQAIHESAWGTSRLSRDGHNYFGIKATNKAGTRGVIKMSTGEHVGGADISVIAGFRAYNDMTESFVDHGRFFLENSRYSRAMASTNDARAFIRLVADAGYATDPSYARKVLAYMDKFNLYRYDR